MKKNLSKGLLSYSFSSTSSTLLLRHRLGGSVEVLIPLRSGATPGHRRLRTRRSLLIDPHHEHIRGCLPESCQQSQYL